MLPAIRETATVILKLRDEADALGAPVVCVNDNFGQWHADRARIVSHARRGHGKSIIERIAPRRNDYFIVKPQFSGFYATNLPVLLPKLGVTRVVLTGIAADICVLFTAADAHMRAYGLWVPADAVVSTKPAHTRRALEIMKKSMTAETKSTEKLGLAAWAARGGPPPSSAT